MWNQMSCIIPLATVLLLSSSSCANAFSPPPIARTASASSHWGFSAAATAICRARSGHCSSASSPLFSPLSSAATADDFDSSSEESEDNDDNSMTTTTAEQVDQVFNAVDTDGSGAIDLEEFNRHLSPAGYSSEDIEESFAEIDSDSNGVISRAEFRKAILDASTSDDTYDDDCPKGYILNSVKQKYERMGPIGRMSQKVEMLAPFRRTYRRISNLFGVDTKNIAKLGPSFVLAYSIISNLNGAASFSVAWYISCKQTGLSPLVPGQWKSLLKAYGMVYGLVQVLRPFRVALAVAMSKLSAEYLEMTQAKLKCSRGVAVGCQYMMGQFMMVLVASVGVTIVSLLTGVPIFG